MKSSATETNYIDKIEFATPSVNANLSQSLGWLFVHATWTYVHFTNQKKKNCNHCEPKKKTLPNEQILLVETQKKNKNYSTQLHLRLFEERIKAYLDWEGREREWRGVE